MPDLIETVIVRLSNWIRQRPERKRPAGGLHVGHVHGAKTGSFGSIPTIKRAEHIQILGKTGTGKSSLLKYFLEQDIGRDRGVINFDLHADTTPHALRLLTAEETRRGSSHARQWSTPGMAVHRSKPSDQSRPTPAGSAR
jgi:hypothetical protein